VGVLRRVKEGSYVRVEECTRVERVSGANEGVIKGKGGEVRVKRVT
jgi:hypothetical protein